MKIFSLLITCLLSFSIYAQEEVSIEESGLTLYGTLLSPDHDTHHAILIISGSGPTDRDGNTLAAGVRNDALKKLAEELTAKGYATLRYDKRGVGKSTGPSVDQKTLRFEHYVKDAAAWVNYLKAKYTHVTVVGHSQGALTGMLAIEHTPMDKLVSLAGMAEGLYATLKNQLAAQPKFVTDAAYPILDSLNKGVKVDSVPPYLMSIFRPDIQDYFMSFMKYDPQEVIKKVDIPILIIQGDNDLQITVDSAEKLHASNHKAELEILKGMNHVLRLTDADPTANMATYYNSELPIFAGLTDLIHAFIQKSP